MTPHDLEARLGEHPTSATVAAVLEELRADPDWTATEVLLDRRAVRVELAHTPTGMAYTLNRRRRGALTGRTPV